MHLAYHDSFMGQSQIGQYNGRKDWIPKQWTFSYKDTENFVQFATRKYPAVMTAPGVALDGSLNLSRPQFLN